VAEFVPSPYIEFDSHESAIQNEGIQHVRNLREAGRRAIEAATGRPAYNLFIQCHGGVHGNLTYSVVAR
jgi:hypothetical protein